MPPNPYAGQVSSTGMVRDAYGNWVTPNTGWGQTPTVQGTSNITTPQPTLQSGNILLSGSQNFGNLNLPQTNNTNNTNDTNTTGLYDGGGGSGTTYRDTSAARAGTQASLDSLSAIEANKLKEAQGNYDSVLEAYGLDEIANLGAYTKNKEGNEQNREVGQQAGMLAAANGGRGLNSVLASIGALGGTGRTLANRAVANEANIDIGNSNRTFDTNATALFDSYGNLKKEEKQRRLDAKGTYDKTVQQTKYDTTESRQKLLKEMAGLWGDAGNFGQSDVYTGKAAAETANLVKNTRPNVSEYARAPLSYSAPALKSYLAGANDMTVNTSGGSSPLPINGAIYTSTKKREQA